MLSEVNATSAAFEMVVIPLNTLENRTNENTSDVPTVNNNKNSGRVGSIRLMNQWAVYTIVWHVRSGHVSEYTRTTPVRAPYNIASRNISRGNKVAAKSTEILNQLEVVARILVKSALRQLILHLVVLQLLDG